MQFDNPTTARLPISKNIKDNQARLAQPIKELLKLGQEFQSTASNTEKHNSLKREAEIHKLYDPGPDKINIIENEDPLSGFIGLRLVPRDQATGDWVQGMESRKLHGSK